MSCCGGLLAAGAETEMDPCMEARTMRIRKDNNTRRHGTSNRLQTTQTGLGTTMTQPGADPFNDHSLKTGAGAERCHDTNACTV